MKTVNIVSGCGGVEGYTVPKRSEGGGAGTGDGITERSFHQRVRYKSLNQIEKFPNLVGDGDDDYGTFHARAYVCAKVVHTCIYFFVNTVAVFVKWTSL